MLHMFQCKFSINALFSKLKDTTLRASERDLAGSGVEEEHREEFLQLY